MAYTESDLDELGGNARSEYEKWYDKQPDGGTVELFLEEDIGKKYRYELEQLTSKKIEASELKLEDAKKDDELGKQINALDNMTVLDENNKPIDKSEVQDLLYRLAQNETYMQCVEKGLHNHYKSDLSDNINGLREELILNQLIMNYAKEHKIDDFTLDGITPERKEKFKTEFKDQIDKYISGEESIKISPEVMAATCAIHNEQVRLFAEQRGLKKLGERVKSFDDKMKQKYPRVWPIVKNAGINVAAGAALGPAGLALVSAGKTIKAYKNLRKEAKEKGYDKVGSYLKADKAAALGFAFTVVGSAISAYGGVSAGLAGNLGIFSQGSEVVRASLGQRIAKAAASAGAGLSSAYKQLKKGDYKGAAITAVTAIGAGFGGVFVGEQIHNHSEWLQNHSQAAKDWLHEHITGRLPGAGENNLNNVKVAESPEKLYQQAQPNVGTYNPATPDNSMPEAAQEPQINGNAQSENGGAPQTASQTASPDGQSPTTPSDEQSGIIGESAEKPWSYDPTKPHEDVNYVEMKQPTDGIVNENAGDGNSGVDNSGETPNVVPDRANNEGITENIVNSGGRQAAAESAPEEPVNNDFVAYGKHGEILGNDTSNEQPTDGVTYGNGRTLSPVDDDLEADSQIPSENAAQDAHTGVVGEGSENSVESVFDKAQKDLENAEINTTQEGNLTVETREVSYEDGSSFSWQDKYDSQTGELVERNDITTTPTDDGGHISTIRTEDVASGELKGVVDKYDGNNHLTERQEISGYKDENGYDVTTSMKTLQYDDNGKLLMKHETEFGYDSGGNISEFTTHSDGEGKCLGNTEVLRDKDTGEVLGIKYQDSDGNPLENGDLFKPQPVEAQQEVPVEAQQEVPAEVEQDKTPDKTPDKAKIDALRGTAHSNQPPVEVSAGEKTDTPVIQPIPTPYSYINGNPTETNGVGVPRADADPYIQPSKPGEISSETTPSDVKGTLKKGVIAMGGGATVATAAGIIALRGIGRRNEERTSSGDGKNINNKNQQPIVIGGNNRKGMVD